LAHDDVLTVAVQEPVVIDRKGHRLLLDFNGDYRNVAVNYPEAMMPDCEASGLLVSGFAIY